MKPKAVRDAEEEANRILGEINKSPDPAVPPDPAAPPTPAPVVPAEPPVVPEPPVIPEPPAPPVDHEQKYKTLQGKYDVEVPKLYGEVGDLKVRLAEALSVITELQKAPVVPATPAPAVAPPPGIGYMRKEMPEMEDAVRYIVKEEATKLVQDLVGKKVGEVGEKLNKLEADTVKNAGNTFYNDLATKVPTWATINENADFLKWLDDVEPYTGYKKMDLLQDAVAKLDVVRTAKFFTDFVVGLKAPVKPASSPDKFISPPKPAGGGEPVIPTDEGYVTSGEITKFYNDVATFKYKNREQERAAMEAKINKALQEGKIR